MNKILVIYYSQSGQLRTILDNILSNIKDEVAVTYAEIEMEKPFPFPWQSAHSFFDAMPESVALQPEQVKPLPQEVLNTKYDLIFFGYAPWFLSPSIPATSFLKSEYAQVMKDTPVVTVIGSRNMWLNAQEQVKLMLKQIGARLVANIAFYDDNPNLVSVLSIIRWAFKGQKERSTFLPEAGVQSRDIAAADRFGTPIRNALTSNDVENLHKELLQNGSINLKPGLIILERRGIKNFRKFSAYIREHGNRGDEARKGRVKLFQRLLTVGIFILSPISNFTAWLQLQLNKKAIMKDAEYFKGLKYEEGKV